MSLNETVLPRVAQGEATAIAECLDRYGGLVWALARKHCGNRDMAEDAVQDIFIQLWRAADRFDVNIASEATFVSMIARRRLIDLHRRKDHLASSEPASEIDTLSVRAPDAAARAELKDEAAKAESCLCKLPNEQQKVIRLSIYEGLSHSRIAEATGLSLGTVKTHIRRGLIELREMLFLTGESV